MPIVPKPIENPETCDLTFTLSPKTMDTLKKLAAREKITVPELAARMIEQGIRVWTLMGI